MRGSGSSRGRTPEGYRTGCRTLYSTGRRRVLYNVACMLAPTPRTPPQPGNAKAALVRLPRGFASCALREPAMPATRQATGGPLHPSTCRPVRPARCWQLVAALVLLCLVPELELASAKRARKKRVPRGRGEADTRPLGPSVFPEVLTASECDELLSKAKQLPTAEGKVGAGGDTDTRTRRSTVRALPREQFEATYATITNRVTEANDAKWMFNGLRLQGIQLGEYTGDDHGFYNWHVDQSVAATDLDPATKRLLSARSAGGWRVLSATLQLSDPTNYTGGELLVGTGSAHRPPAERGTLVVFPSYVIHTVRPVRGGTRFSLVIWFDGVDPAYAENAEREQAANAAAIAESGESDTELAYQLLAKTQHSLGKLDAAERSCSRVVQLHRERSVGSGQLSYCRKLLAVTAFNSGRQEEGIQLQEAAVNAAFGTNRWQTDVPVSGWTDPDTAATVEQLATMMSKVSSKNEVVVPVYACSSQPYAAFCGHAVRAGVACC